MDIVQSRRKRARFHFELGCSEGPTVMLAGLRGGPLAGCVCGGSGVGGVP